MNQLKIAILLFLVIFNSCVFAEDTSRFESSAYLTVKDVCDEGLVLVLNDGSEWDIKYFSGGWRILGWGWTEQTEVSHWSMGDKIEIQYPGSGNFIDFVLLISNLSRSEEALATLKQAPSADYSECLSVLDFDQETNLIIVSDGTAWFKTAADMNGALFQQKSISEVKWESGNALTLIRGEGWFNTNTFFLWNHATNEMPIINRVE